MAYSHISLKQFRSYGHYQVDLSPGVTIVVGPNGSGKTNLLEAIYVLSQGTSFRVADKDLVRYGHQQYKLEGAYDGLMRTVLFDLRKTPPKRMNVDGVDRQRLSPHQKVPVVLFEPDELRILSGSPQRRRDYLDGLVSRLWPEAGRWRSRYERVLRQRNAILKQASEYPSSAEDEFFVWDIKLAEYASQLIGQRQRLISDWNATLSEVYSQIANQQSSISVIYKTDCSLAAYGTNLLRLLNANRRRDIARGFTSNGPHRDDFDFVLNGNRVLLSASRGELRTLVLALKIAELRLTEAANSRKPVLLLDDVFSELDATRRRALAELASGHQTVITTTNADIISRYFSSEHRVITT